MVFDIQNNFHSSGCNIKFYIPGKELVINLKLVQCFPGLIETLSDNNDVGFRKDMCENGPFLPHFIDVGWYRNFYCSTEKIPRDKCVEQHFYRKESFLQSKTDHALVSLLLGKPSKGAPFMPSVVEKEVCADITKPNVSVLATLRVIVLISLQR